MSIWLVLSESSRNGNVNGSRSCRGEEEREKQEKEDAERERRRGGGWSGQQRGTRRGLGNRCVHIIPSVLLISSKDPTPRHLVEACSLHSLTLASGLIRRRQCNVFFFFLRPLNGTADSYLKWMKALGKRKSNREGTLLPVLSGRMSRAAINKCEFLTVKERERGREGEREGGERKKQQCGTWHSLVRLCRRGPRGIRFNEEKTFKCAEASFVDVETRLISLFLCRLSLSGINRRLLIESREPRFGK